MKFEWFIYMFCLGGGGFFAAKTTGVHCFINIAIMGIGVFGLVVALRDLSQNQHSH